MGSGEHVLEVQSATCIVHVGGVGEVPGEDNHEDDDEGEDYADQENILKGLIKRVLPLMY